MKLAKAVSLAAILAIIAAPYNQALALDPPPAAPFTLWNFLGIPQAFHKIRDASSNTRGNHPGLERKPPLKALADPRNLMSPNPAIAKAAEIKTQEDMAPQKIKAIKYLASVGCGCYPGVKEALMAALEDCTEEVRYQAVLAIEDAAGQHCEVCNKNCCCDEELTTKLSQIAYEKNDKCCWVEASERVREAAAKAMRACCPGQGPVTEGVPTPPPVPESGNIPEGAPVPPPPVVPEPSARTGAGRDGQISATRIHESRTKVMLPGGAVVSDEPSMEVVTVDFGNLPSTPARTAPATSRRTTADAPSARQSIVQQPVREVAPPSITSPSVPAPAMTARKQPPRPAAPAEFTNREAEPRTLSSTRSTQNTSASAPLGPSSRRAAAERGLAAPQQALKDTAPASVAKATTPKRAPESKQPAGLKAWLFPSGTKVSDNRSSKDQASLANYQASDAPRTSKPAAKSGSSQSAERPAAKQDTAVQGTVWRISASTGTVEVKLPRGTKLNVGDRLKVSHDYLLNGVALGYLEVTDVGHDSVTARPIGDLQVGLIARGDDAVYEPGRARGRNIQSASAGRSPSLASKVAVDR